MNYRMREEGQLELVVDREKRRFSRNRLWTIETIGKQFKFIMPGKEGKSSWWREKIKIGSCLYTGGN